MKRRLRAPSPAFVISLVALFVALGGTTYAATSLPKNSVGTKQIKNNAVTSKKIARGAIGLQTVKSSQVNIGPDQQNGASANCPAGTKALSGGWDSAGGNFEVRRSEPTSANAGWQVIVVNNSLTTLLTVYAVCSKAG
jgi:hypothetical protein